MLLPKEGEPQDRLQNESLSTNPQTALDALKLWGAFFTTEIYAGIKTEGVSDEVAASLLRSAEERTWQWFNQTPLREALERLRLTSPGSSKIEDQ